MSEAERWAAQGVFWEAVAGTCAGHSAVFCYDLINEPLSPAGKREPGTWYSGKKLGDYDFLQMISLDAAGRSRTEVARQWIRILTKAIRKHDPRTPVTVGLLPTAAGWGHLSGFISAELTGELDFISGHIYIRKPANRTTPLSARRHSPSANRWSLKRPSPWPAGKRIWRSIWRAPRSGRMAG